MDNFEVDVEELSIPARKTLNIIDSYLDIMKGKGVRITEVAVFDGPFDDLDNSLKHWSEDNHSITTHAYRGVKITRQERSG
jgi:hypothetical protein